MISLNPIALAIQRRLFQKMKLLGREGNTPNTIVKKGGLTNNQLSVRSPFIRMTSGLENPVILIGGELQSDLGGRVDIPSGGGTGDAMDEVYGPRSANSSFYNNNYRKEDPNIYKRPMPGLKSIDVQFKGGTRALRQGSVSWTCWSFEDINRLTPHFLSVGKTILLEWGWVYGRESLANLPTFIGSNGIKREAYTDYKNTVIDANGDFDMLLGIVSNFEYNTRDDGGFDCTTSITSMGADVLGNPIASKGIASTAPRLGISNKMTEKELDEAAKKSLDEQIKFDSDVTLKTLIEHIDDYVKTQLARPKNDIRDRDTGKLEYIIESEPENNIGFKTKTKLSTEGKDKYASYSPNKFIMEYIGGKNVKRIDNVWVRWGWFEDNILSKFLSLVSPDFKLTPTAEFRSIEPIETKSGKTSKLYESTRITNHPYLETIDINNYILPGQFKPLVKPKVLSELDKITDDTINLEWQIKGDSEYLLNLSKIVNGNFKPFTTGDEGVFTMEEETGEILKDGVNVTNFIGPFANPDALIKEKVEKEVTFKVGSYGFLRNMLINTKLIKKAFGVTEDGVETNNVKEALQQLFALLNQDIPLWKFNIASDEVESYRNKIIDDNVTAIKLPSPAVEVSTTNPFQRGDTTKSTYDATTDSVTNKGVFFFPVWRHDSIVKRQNIAAKIPSAMAMSIMYGANADSTETLGATPSEVGSKESEMVAKVGADPENKDKANDNVSIALHQNGFEYYGGEPTSKDKVTVPKLSATGGSDNVLKFFRDNPKLISQKYADRVTERDEQIQAAADNKEAEELFGTSRGGVPPPLPEYLTDDDWRELGKKLKLNAKLKSKEYKGITYAFSPLVSLYSSKYDDKNKLKQQFIDSMSFNTSLFQTLETTVTDDNKPLILPVDLELDIDGIGGILPSNSFHSSYLPQRYQDDAIFQIFDVNHTVDSSGWNVALKGKMRSSASRVTKTTVEVKSRFKKIKNQFAKAKSASDAKKLVETQREPVPEDDKKKTSSTTRNPG
tara:strand:+ start:791 stop:3823 length:3033 start_codon:yes stop_codon:yes gene_type:complete